jgi:hypothetical protein
MRNPVLEVHFREFFGLAQRGNISHDGSRRRIDHVTALSYDHETPVQAMRQPCASCHERMCGAYSQLDSEAQQIRVGKDRLAGGGWKLNTFYAAVSAPSAGSDTEAGDWQAHIIELKKWVAKDPQSAAARVALAIAYMGWGWEARGSGYANTVSQEGWDLFKKRVGIAKTTLVEAARLKEKCPGWFYVMQNISRAEAWSKSDEKELFDQAISFEPGFYYFYQNHAQFLLPKWYGAEGETQAFINDVTAGVPEPDGSMLYFELTDSVACQCDPERDTLKGISWSKVKEGYANLERLFGTVNVKNNRYAYMAYMSPGQSGRGARVCPHRR